LLEHLARAEAFDHRAVRADDHRGSGKDPCSRAKRSLASSGEVSQVRVSVIGAPA
jgi:hypothetical protein